MSEQLVSRKTLSDQVAEGVLRLIIQRGLNEGDSLPPTSELSVEFGVSRTVVREALAELSGRGLLNRQQGREGIFSLPGSKELEHLFATRLEHNSIDYLDLHEFRSVVEIGAARLAARNATVSDIATLRRCLKNLQTASGDDEHHDADLLFHQAVADASHNSLMSLVLNALSPLLHESRREAWASYVSAGGKISQSLQQHQDIVELIAAADVNGVGKAMETDLDESRVALERHIRQPNRASKAR